MTKCAPKDVPTAPKETRTRRGFIQTAGIATLGTVYGCTTDVSIPADPDAGGLGPFDGSARLDASDASDVGGLDASDATGQDASGEVVLSDCGGTLDGSTHTFMWADSANPPASRKYDLHLDIGDGNGLEDQGPSVQFPTMSWTVSGLPTDGREITLRLYWWDDDVVTLENFVECTYTAQTVELQGCMTYAEIEALSPFDAEYFTTAYTGAQDNADVYLAEFLYLQRDAGVEVANWTVDENQQVVCAQPNPEPTAAAFRLPPPSGGNDTAMIQSAIDSHAEVVGTGATYRVAATIAVGSSTQIWDVPTIRTTGVNTTYRVTAANVEFYRSPIDAANQRGSQVGWRVESTATDFVVSHSGLKNIRTGTGNAAGVWIRGANNFRITCNEFKDLVLDDPANSTAGSRSILAVLNSNSSGTLPGGYVANNIAENITTRRRNNGTTDPEFYKQQGYPNTDPARRPKILANRCVNAGKRLAKFQSSEGLVASNFYHWRDRQGPVGERLQLTVISIQVSSSRIRCIHNRVRLEGEARYGSLLVVNGNNGNNYSEIHYDCNLSEHIDVPPENHYALGIYLAAAPDASGRVIRASSAKDNIWVGPGGTNHIFRIDPNFGGPLPPAGFDISGNVVTTPVLISELRGSGATYVP